MNRETRRKYKLSKAKADNLKLKYKMVAFAELYNQKPDDDCFKDFKYLDKVKSLAEELKKVRAEGKIK